MTRPGSFRRITRRLLLLVDRLLIPTAILLTFTGGVLAALSPTSAVLVLATLGTSIALLLVALATRQTPGGRLSPAVLESALAEAARAIAALQGRTERLERGVTYSKKIARSADELPAWIALAAAAPIADAALHRGIDPRALLAVVDQADRLAIGEPVLVLADDVIGSLAAHALLHVRADTRPVILASTSEGADQLRALLADEPRISVRAGTVRTRSFGNVAGPWFSAEDVAGLEGVRLVFVAGPSLSLGAAARHAVVAGLLELTPAATLIVNSADETPVSRASALWESTAPHDVRVRRVSPWVVEFERA